MCPARASDSAASLPMPVPAPVIRMTFFMGFTSDQTAVNPQDLPVDPSRLRADQEAHDAGNVFWLSQAFQRRHLGERLDLLFAFAVQEQVRGHRAWCDRVDGNVATAHFLG